MFLCAGAAWYAAGLFLRQSPREAAVNAGVAGALCGLLAFLLPLAGAAGGWAGAAVPALAMVLPMQQRWDAAKRGEALLLAVGGCGALAALCRACRACLPAPAALAVAGLLAAVFCAAGHVLRELFPPEDWREYFSRREPFPVHLWQVWTALSLMAALELALPLAAGPGPAQAALLGAAGLILYWGTVYAVCLMVAYRRVRLTALIDQNYRSEMDSFMSVIRAQRHDYNFHVQALCGLVASGDLEACRQYLDNLVQDSAALNNLLPLRDPAVAALVNSFQVMAREAGIALHMDIQNDLSCVVTSVYETNKVIGNLLQNAIDEVRTHADKSFGIHLYILKRGENCIIHVANRVVTKSGPGDYLEEVYRPGRTTKPGHEGIGLSSVRQLLSRHQGVVYSRLEDGVVHFIAKIPLRLEGGPV